MNSIQSDLSSAERSSSALTRASIVVAISVFLNFTGFTLILPVIPFLVGRYVTQDRIGLYVGLIVSVFAFCAFCAAPVLGALSDRIGRKPVLILSLLGSAVGYTIFGIGGALWILFLGRVIDGLTAGNISAMYAYVADTTAPAERGRVYGLLGAVGGVGFMLGPVVGGILGGSSPSMPLFAAAVLTLANVVWVYIALPESVNRQTQRPKWRWRALNPLAQLSHALSVSSLRAPFAAAFAFYLAGGMLQSNLAVYLNEILQFGPSGIGWVLFAVGVMDIVSQGLLTRALLPRIGAPALSRLGLIVNALGFALIGSLIFVPRIAFLVLSIVIFTLGDGLFQPAISGIIANAAPDAAQGLVQGANQSQQALARMIGPLLAALLSPLAVGAPYWVGALIAVVGAVFLSTLRQNVTEKNENGDE